MANRRSPWNWPRGGALAAAALLVTGAMPAAAVNDLNPFRAAPDVWVYLDKNADGFDDFTAVVPLGSHTVDLRVTGGEIASDGETTLCRETAGANGQEICALAVRIQLTGNGRFTGFTSAPGLDVRSFIHPNGKLLRLNLTRADDPLPATFPPPLLGSLTVDVTGTGVIVSVIGDEAIGPNRADSRVVRTTTIMAPEPGELLLLLTGLAGLTGLDRWRRRRAAPDA